MYLNINDKNNVRKSQYHHFYKILEKKIKFNKNNKE